MKCQSYCAATDMDESEREQLRLEREERRQQEKKAKGKKDYFSVVTAVQLALFLILAVIIAVVSKTGSSTAQKLRADFASLMNWSIIEGRADEAIKTIKEFLNEPFSLLPAFSPVKPASAEAEKRAQTEESTAQQESETETQKTAETSKDKSEKSDDETSETENMGGEDIEIYKAADNTSFSPVEATCAILRPVESKKYTSYFGYRINPITNKKAFHTGLDIAAAHGTKIRAAYNGTVRKTGEDSHSGKYIFLAHDDGYETFYCHCSEILAVQGAVIRQGETIAKVGSTGWSTGPHLHFEIRKNGTRLNPLNVLENK